MESVSYGLAENQTLLADIAAIEEKHIRELIPDSAHIKVAVIGGGFPCSEFSALKAGGQGIKIDKRVYEIGRIAKLAKKALPGVKIKRFYHNPFVDVKRNGALSDRRDQ